MGSEWTFTNIDALKADSKGSIAIGPFGSRMKSDCYVEDGIPVIRGTNITGGPTFEGNFVFITEEKADTLGSSNVYEGDLVFPHRGSIGEVGVLLDEKRFVLSSSLMKLTCDKRKAFPRYLYYYFKSHIGKHELLKNASQVGTPGIGQPLTSLKAIELSIPPLPEQKAIAHILGSLDDKIELNRRMNATLEGMAQALFKSWFVDFDPVIDNALAAGNPIPDELADRAEIRRQALADGSANREAAKAFPAAFQETEELGWIPEGWEERAIDDSFELLGGHSFKSENYIEDGLYGVVTIKNVQDGSFVQNCSSRITELPVKMKSYCNLNAGDVLLSLTGNVGRVCAVSDGSYVLNQRVSKIVGRDDIPEAFCYFYFRQEALYERIITIAKGTAQQNLSPIETAKLKQAMPCNQTIANLSPHLDAIYKKMAGNISASQTLTKLRDTLLPKLISGELRIEDAERMKRP